MLAKVKVRTFITGFTSKLAAQVASDYQAKADYQAKDDYQAKGTLKTLRDIYQSYITCVPNICDLILKGTKEKDLKTMAGTRVLLVGATGKTGSSVADALLEAGAFVSAAVQNWSSRTH